MTVVWCARAGCQRSTSAAGRASRSHRRVNAPASRSEVRSAVEHVFATQKHRMGLFVRPIGIDRAKTRIGLANIVFNFKRYAFWQGKTAIT